MVTRQVRIHIIVGFLVCVTNIGSAQITSPPSQYQSLSHTFAIRSLVQDTTEITDTLQPTTIPPKVGQSPTSTQKISYESTKSPGLAVLLSAVIPGSGQIYNESYWKAPVIWGLGGYWAYEWIQLNDKYKDFRDKYQQSIKDLPPYGNSQLQRVRDFYRDERDKFAWYLGALYFANLLDAYVGANLFDFNVSSDLSADGVLVPRITATVHLNF